VLFRSRLFNLRGFDDVSIDEIMSSVGLTRGGFYNHFTNKDVLYSEAIQSYARADPSATREGVGLNPTKSCRAFARQFLSTYLSPKHLNNPAFHCPMIALPSDAARAGTATRQAYENLFRSMIGIFEAAIVGADKRQRAVAMATLCVGAMVVARTLNNEGLAREIRTNAYRQALQLSGLDDED